MVSDKKKETLEFSMMIERLSKEKGISCMDAILLHCENTGLELEVAAKMINANLKSRLKVEAEDLNFLEKPKSKRLPI